MCLVVGSHPDSGTNVICQSHSSRVTTFSKIRQLEAAPKGKVPEYLVSSSRLTGCQHEFRSHSVWSTAPSVSCHQVGYNHWQLFLHHRDVTSHVLVCISQYSLSPLGWWVRMSATSELCGAALSPSSANSASPCGFLQNSRSAPPISGIHSPTLLSWT